MCLYINVAPLLASEYSESGWWLMTYATVRRVCRHTVRLVKTLSFCSQFAYLMKRCFLQMQLRETEEQNAVGKVRQPRRSWFFNED